MTFAEADTWAAAVLVDEQMRCQLCGRNAFARRFSADHCEVRDRPFVPETARRMPGRSVGDLMNSTPAVSNAAFTSSSVDERLGDSRFDAARPRCVIRLPIASRQKLLCRQAASGLALFARGARLGRPRRHFLFNSCFQRSLCCIQIIARLEVNPKLRRRSKIPSQTQRRIARNCTAA